MLLLGGVLGECQMLCYREGRAASELLILYGDS